MGQFDWGTYTEGAGGGEFVDEDQMLKYLAYGTVFAITGIREGEGKFGAQWYLDFVDDAGAERTKSFSKGNVERDSRMRRLQETIAASGEPISARFVKVGKRYDVQGA